MYNPRIKVDNIALWLLIIVNILDLFVPRMEEGNYFVRMPIQLIDGALIGLMWMSLLLRRNNWTPITRIILWFITLTLIYSFAYLNANEFNISDFAPYIRLLLWTTSLIFFYEMMLKNGINNKLFCFYVITFIVAITKKINEASLFESETLGGGDTASLPLLFIIPIILRCFSNKMKFILIAVVSILILFSLRRTAILGLALCLPFIYKYIRIKLKAYHIITLGLGFTLLIVYAWRYIGDAVLYRFENLITGDSGGTKDTYGSGRSEFYMIVWNDWLNSKTLHVLFGKGLTSVEHFLIGIDNVQHAHNDFLEIIYTFGLLGIGIWFLFILQLWKLKKQIKLYTPENINLYYISIISYLIIAVASGCILRITTMPLALSLSILLSQVQKKRSHIRHLEQESQTDHNSKNLISVIDLSNNKMDHEQPNYNY